MSEFKRGTLRIGRSKKMVTSRRQAVAIALSEARRKFSKSDDPLFSATLKKFSSGYGGERGAQWDRAIGDTQRVSRRFATAGGVLGGGVGGAFLGARHGVRGMIAGGAMGAGLYGAVGHGAARLRQGIFNRGLRNRLASPSRGYGSQGDVDRSYGSALVAQGRRASGLMAAGAGPLAPVGYGVGAAQHGLFRANIRSRMGL